MDDVLNDDYLRFGVLAGRGRKSSGSLGDCEGDLEDDLSMM